jgi:hypothetical protein
MTIDPEELAKRHKYFAVETNNAGWALLERESLSNEQKEQLISLAFTAAYHWSQVGKPINFGRADCLVSRALIAAGRDLMAALRYARRYREAASAPDGEAWDIALAEAGLARAFAATGNEADARTHYQRALTVIGELNEADREICSADLARGPWFDVVPTS